jgi:hypothetical protein
MYRSKLERLPVAVIITLVEYNWAYLQSGVPYTPKTANIRLGWKLMTVTNTLAFLLFGINYACKKFNSTGPRQGNMIPH